MPEIRDFHPDMAVDIVEIPAPGQSPKLKRVYDRGRRG